MKAKVIVLMILLVLFTIFVTQNTHAIDISVFFWDLKMSAIVLISLAGLFGVIAGFIIATLVNRQEKKKTKTEDSKKKEIEDNEITER